MTAGDRASGAVRGGVKLLLRLEGAVVLLVCSYFIYWYLMGPPWWAFVVLFFWPDIAIAGYVFGRRVGSLMYNVTHSYVGPMLLLVLFTTQMQHLFALVALLWAAHIGFDHMLGHGLKYVSGFGDTHLGRVGSRSEKAD